eukprot:TRINITY_DN54957_c0_g1_i1.p1 TRINITY_DN54957_c0_g1~~TRINITY_DN54957_c0_g1_i1.p1  ORF type:complete len:853 (-),score=230.84 TRINITY_DN54957_c0_g1_i1:50-2584(-)
MALVVSSQGHGRHGGVGGASDEVAGQLQRRLAQESSDRDAAKLALHRLKTAVDFYRKRMQSVAYRSPGVGTGDDDHTLYQRTRDLVKDMEAEVRTTDVDCTETAKLSSQLALGSPGSPVRPKNYEVLRQSLEEAQRRCENLNIDMVQQSEANEELVDALGTVKDANKRLLEQIRQQNSEIATLTQQRVEDEETMDQMARRHDTDREALRQDTQRQVVATRDAGAERHNQVYNRLTDKLRYVRARSEIIAQEAARIAQDLHDRRADAAALVSSVQGQLQGAEKDFSLHCDALRQRHLQQKRNIEEQINDHHGRVRSERDLRHQDGIEWGQKLGAMANDKDDVHGRHGREVTQLSAHAQALERALHAERQAWLEDRAGLERENDEHSHQRNSRRMALDQLQRDIVSTESAISAISTESSSLEQSIVELKRQLRESDDALAAAISGNEHLRDQMEEQRKRFQEKNETDLNDCRAAYEQKLADAQIAHEADIAMSRKQAEAMEKDLAAQGDDMHRHRSNIDAIEEECASMARDGAMWRSHCDAAKSSREIHERDLHEAKQQFTSQRVKLQADIDHAGSASAALDEELRAMTAELADFRRNAAARETEMATRRQAAEAMLRDSQQQLADRRQRVRDVADHHKRVGAEAAGSRERMLERQMALEKSVEAQARLLEDERRRFRDLLEKERKAADEVREDLQRERDLTSVHLRRVHDENRSKVVGAERERSRVQDLTRTELMQASQHVAQQQQQVKVLEHDINRVRSLLAESESNAQWVRQEHDHGHHSTHITLRQLEDDARAVINSFEQARREEASLQQQIEAQRNRNEHDRLQWRTMLDDMARQSPQTAR